MSRLLPLLLVACHPAVGGSAPTTPPAAYVTFVVNVHDIHHVQESADTLLHLVKIFSAHHVRGDFYLTAPMTEFYSAQRPDVIDALKSSGMTISYHERPPSPTYPHLDAPLAGLDDAALSARLREYETFHQDLETGVLDPTRPGGYAYVASVFGKPPTTVSILTGNQRIRDAAFGVFKSMGARSCLAYHEGGTQLDQPYVYQSGLLQRPSDLGVTRWNPPGSQRGGEGTFWWNRVTRDADANPTRHLQEVLQGWTGSRPPFVNAIIHENNFVRSGPETWTLMYFTDTTKDVARPPPWSMNAEDRSTVRPASEQAAIWTAYEELVRYAAEHARVVTSEDIVGMAGAP